MGSNLYSRALRGAPLSVPAGNTHAPGPSGMPTGGLRYLPLWPLFTVCALVRGWQLTEPYPVCDRDKWWYQQIRKLLIKTRPTTDSGGPSILRMISITNNVTIKGINHHSSSLTMPYRTYSSRRGTRDKLVSTQDHDFPGFLPVCMRSSRGWSKSLVYPLLTTKQLQSVLMYETISIHKANAYSKSKGVVIESEHHNKILCQSSEILAFKSMQGMHFLKAFPFLQKSYFA